MQGSDSESRALTPEESWHAIQATMDAARSSMYLAGTTTILLLWGADSLARTNLAVCYRDLCDRPHGAQPVDYRAAVGRPDGGGDGGQCHHWTPRGQERRGRRRHSQRWHQGVPILAGGSGSRVPNPYGSGYVEC